MFTGTTYLPIDVKLGSAPTSEVFVVFNVVYVASGDTDPDYSADAPVTFSPSTLPYEEWVKTQAF